MKKTIGFNMKVWRRHLDNLVRELPRSSGEELRRQVEDYVACDIHGLRSRSKTLTILFKIWVNPPKQHERLRRDALNMFPYLSAQERLALHWGMTVLAYPFFKQTVYELGNLFQLQDVVPSQQLMRKMRALYGERHSVRVATTAILSSLRDWGVITTSGQHENKQAEKIEIIHCELKRWLTEVMIHTSGHQALLLDAINQFPSFFPFASNVTRDDLVGAPFHVARHGFNQFSVEIH